MSDDSDFTGVLLSVYDQLSRQMPQPSRLRTDGERVLAVLMACRGRDFSAAHACIEELRPNIETLPPKVNRERVYLTLAAGVILADVVDATPEWLQDRDDALSQARLGLKHLRSVLRRRDMGDLVSDAERAVNALAECGGSWADVDELRPAEGGRRRDSWRHELRRRLDNCGVKRDPAAALLRIAGLAAKAPTPKGDSAR